MTDFLVRCFVKEYENTDNADVRTSYGILSSMVGICCNVLLFAAKLLIGVGMHSLAIMADAFNNLSDAASSVISFVGVKMANKPADKEHPFGHGRIEYIAALIVSFLVIEVGFTFLKSSLEKIRNPEEITFQMVPFLILVLSVGVKLWMALFNRKLGNRIQSKVLLAPVLYLFLKNIWTGAAFLLVLLVALFKGVALPELNLDALIYYSFAAYAALHGRKWAEAVWSWKRAALGVCLLAVGIVLSRSYYTHYFVPGIVLYQLLAVIGIWMMVNERWLGEVRPFMTCTFFIYATHFVVVRFLNKAAALLFPGSQLVSMFMYVCMPLLAVTLCYQAARVLRRYRPDIWKTLNGGR